jgi:hypothetical protein
LVLLLFLSQLRVLGLEVEDHADSGEVESVVEQFTDAPQPVQVVGAIAAGTAFGSVGFKQPPRLVKTQVLHPGSD